MHSSKDHQCPVQAIFLTCLASDALVSVRALLPLLCPGSHLDNMAASEIQFRSKVKVQFQGNTGCLSERVAEKGLKMKRHTLKVKCLEFCRPVVVGISPKWKSIARVLVYGLQDND